MVIIEKIMLPLHLNYCWPLLSEMDGAVFSCYIFATFLLNLATLQNLPKCGNLLKCPIYKGFQG